MSDSVRSHRRQPTRLPNPWDSPGKNTGVDCHFLLQCMKVKSQSEVAQSCLTLSDSMDCSQPGSSTHGIFQARVLEWGAIAFSSFLSREYPLAFVGELVWWCWSLSAFACLWSFWFLLHIWHLNKEAKYVCTSMYARPCIEPYDYDSYRVQMCCLLGLRFLQWPCYWWHGFPKQWKIFSTKF